ncbi:hypothetical protein [Kribbella ginsengisoli]|uniref:Uncharacterized protein n=1 Tax=Kribbella ginsengisoli TaxID=363865 RepID=A0ABP6XKH4_9ACTN
MTDYLDTLTKAGEVPPPSAETLARAQTAVREAVAGPLRPRRRVPLVALGVGAAVAVVAVVGAVVLGPEQDAPPVAGNQPSAPTVPAVPTGPTPSYRGGGAESCVAAPEGEWLRKQAFAFDGTVLAIEEPSAGHSLFIRRGYTMVTFKVNHWYKAGTADQVRVLVPGPVDPQWAKNMSEAGLYFEVGSRLLVSGQLLGGEQAAWSCGFSRPYDEGTARKWAGTFGK